jgi:hypothetical protein
MRSKRKRKDAVRARLQFADIECNVRDFGVRKPPAPQLLPALRSLNRLRFYQLECSSPPGTLLACSDVRSAPGAES